MKREGNHNAFAEATKSGHKEKDAGKTMVSDLKYCNGNNPEDLKRSVNELSSYVKKHKMEY